MTMNSERLIGLGDLSGPGPGFRARPGERGGEGLLIAAAEQESGDTNVLQHVGKGGINDAVLRQLGSARVRPLPGDGLDQIAALGADLPSEPKREAIARSSHRPAFSAIL